MHISVQFVEPCLPTWLVMQIIVREEVVTVIKSGRAGAWGRV